MNITLRDLTLAYKKAKADVFFEHTNHQSQEFAAYEANLNENLSGLLDRIQAPTREWMADLGGHWYVAKSLEESDSELHASEAPFFLDSDSVGRWGTSKARLAKRGAKFRVIGDCSIDFHVLSALWINLVGHEFDALNRACSMGSRLRRRGMRIGEGEYNLNATGSFRMYAPDFKRWRSYAFSAIRRELDRGRAVIAITLDLKGFYNNVDPKFLLSEGLLKKLPNPLTESELALTALLVRTITAWSERLPTPAGTTKVGLPIGLMASRVIANAVMTQWDNSVLDRLKPIYYGRYVDDMLLVLPAASMNSWGDVWQHISEHLGEMVRLVPGGRPSVRINVEYAPESALLLEGGKQRMFRLHGDRGRDLLSVIEQQVREQSSEWRLLPEIPRDEAQWFKDVMVAEGDGGDPVDNLRKAEGISVRRLKFAMLLRNLEAIERQLKPSIWKSQRQIFYKFAKLHLITPEAIFEFTPYLKRIVELSIACGDGDEARMLIAHTASTIGFLEQNTESVGGGAEWKSFRRYLAKAFRDALFRSALSASSKAQLALVQTAILRLERTRSKLPIETILSISRDMYERDLARVPARAAVIGARRGVVLNPVAQVEIADQDTKRALRAGLLNRFLKFVNHRSGASISLVALLFPTRPFSFGEIVLLAPELLRRERILALITKAVRGAIPLARVSARNDGNGTETVFISSGAFDPVREPIVALPCLFTADKSWTAAAKGRPSTDIKRFLQINELLNAVLRSRTRPKYLVLPELSIPRDWMYGVSYKLAKAGISVVMGVEYEHWGRNHVSNQALLSLVIGKSGYYSQVLLQQEKQGPAPKEAEELKALGRTLKARANHRKLIVRMDDLHFGVLICSELTDMRNRLALRGAVDCLIVVEWNRDLPSFESLVESAALDIHCYVVQSNNRLYGDCRIRVPHCDEWARDLVKIKGGADDYFVLGQLEVRKLRDFQKRSPKASKPFKPVPDGFELAPERSS